MPIATTILGKSVISEAHPLFAGVYEGAMGRPEVTELVESADCLLMLGCFLTDINLGIFTAKLDPSRCIDATSEDLRIRHHHYRDVRLDDFLRGLIERKLGAQPHRRCPRRTNPFAQALAADPDDAGDARCSLFGRLNQMLAEHPEMTVIADIGDSLFGAADLEMHRQTEFLSPAYYTSMGFGVPAARRREHGQPVAADPGHRRRRRVPDDRHGALDDRPARPQPDRRGPEQPRLHDRAVPARRAVQRHPRLGLSSRFPRSSARAWAWRSGPSASSIAALEAALGNTAGFSLLNVHLDPYDRSPALERLASRLSKIVDSKHAEPGRAAGRPVCDPAAVSLPGQTLPSGLPSLVYFSLESWAGTTRLLRAVMRACMSPLVGLARVEPAPREDLAAQCPDSRRAVCVLAMILASLLGGWGEVSCPGDYRRRSAG